MFHALAILLLASLTATQQIGKITPELEVHPPITFETCTTSGGCVTHKGGIVLDANYRWLHTASGETCNPSGFDTAICPDAKTCAQNCALEGADYDSAYGITTSGSAVTSRAIFSNGGSRVYLLDETGKYKDFQVLNQEVSFDVDMSHVPCAYNGALYFSEMPIDGGLSSTNKAGATYGTGYCDAQCPKSVNFLGGTTNVDGTLGSCCNEMDLWEANALVSQMTPHPCKITGEYLCTGSECDLGNLCDPYGCDVNIFRLGNQSFYGPGKIVDTNKPFTVVTQFITDDNTSTGTLSAIKRVYVQDGVVIPDAKINVNGLPAVNSITPELCTAKANVLGDSSFFNTFGGLAQMGKSFERGTVLVFSLWNDLTGGMTWLDGVLGDDPSAPGALRGPCTASDVKSDPSASVTFSNIKIGDLNSTFKQSTSAPAPSKPTQVQWGQCGGIGYTGPTTCASPYTCVYTNPYYSQCI
ncbi:hypothetical protein VKT23_007546 [Stygiomarasmius scandens]|uniref:Glucanase n=1 Tax=Marasmiellus scandens TaxID=2682957 RepID=A0ABR1JMA3_9AGAR